MMLWIEWWKVVAQLRPACSRYRSFLWLVTALVGFSLRSDLLGVTSIVRILGLKHIYYDNLLDFFHSSAIPIEKLTRLWVSIVIRVLPGISRWKGKLLLVGDGLKVPKSGKKMPAVKSLYQSSDSNTKPEYIMGHSCQVVSVLTQAFQSFFAIPLVCRIHEGLIFSNRDQRTLLDKMVMLLDSLHLASPFYFIADAYYASRTLIQNMLLNENHFISRVRSNAVAYLPPPPLSGHRQRGRPKKYGEKIKLTSLFKDVAAMTTAKSPVYQEKGVDILYRSMDLYWRSVGILIRFVLVIHPTRGKMILMTTDLTLNPIDIIRLYGLRFKIEVSFKQAIHTLGTYAYHFWMKAMDPIRWRQGDQYLHRKTQSYRNAIQRKLNAYHRYIQIGLIAQSLLMYLSASFPDKVWASFGSWLRTIRPNVCPSERVTAIAMRNAFPEFLSVSDNGSIFQKFLIDRIDFFRTEGLALKAAG